MVFRSRLLRFSSPVMAVTASRQPIARHSANLRNKIPSPVMKIPPKAAISRHNQPTATVRHNPSSITGDENLPERRNYSPPNCTLIFGARGMFRAQPSYSLKGPFDVAGRKKNKKIISALK